MQNQDLIERNNLLNTFNLDSENRRNNNYNGPIQNSLFGSSLQNSFNFKQKEHEIDIKRGSYLKKKN